MGSSNKREEFIAKAILVAQTNAVNYTRAYVESSKNNRCGYDLHSIAEEEYLMQRNFEDFLNQSIEKYDELCYE